MPNRSAIATGNYGQYMIQSVFGEPEKLGLPIPMGQDYLLKLGKAVLFVAAGDGNVTPTERTAALDLLRKYGASAATLEELRTFDARHAKIENVVTSELRPIARIILHEAVTVSRVDGFGAKEREAAFNAARALGVPTGVVTAIEGLLRIEDEVRNARLSVIGAPPMPPSSTVIVEGATNREREVGVAGPLPRDVGVKIAKAILIVAGADGEITEPEMGWFLGMARAFGGTDDIIEEFVKFDYHSASLTDYLDATTKPYARLILHDAIRMSRQDGFGERERMAAIRAAGLLGLDTSIVAAIEGFLLVEDALRGARMRVLSPS